MPRRSARIIGPETRTRMLDTMRDCRRAATTLCGQAKIGGPEYEAATALMRRVDDFAGVLTGDREFFWQQIHSTPPSPFGPTGGQAQASGPGPSSRTPDVADGRPLP